MGQRPDILLLLLTLPQNIYSQEEVFTTQLFLGRSELNAGLYEGEVKGRKRFGESQVPHGEGTIYYFNTDKFNRVNYTGHWVNGQREGNGTTNFQDGTQYRGGYRQGLETGPGLLLYPNGNTLDAEFVKGKIQGHGVFRYSNGDQREGFFIDNNLSGQVIFTRKDGVTFIEHWKEGKQVKNSKEEEGTIPSLNSAINEDRSKITPIVKTTPPPPPPPSSPPPPPRRPPPPPPPRLSPGPQPSPRGRGGSFSFTASNTEAKLTEETTRLKEEVRSRARSFLLRVFRGVNQ